MKVENPQSTKLKTMLTNQRNLIAAKEREIEDVKKIYDMKKEEERVLGQKDVIEVKDLNQQEILEAVDNKTSRLEDIQKSFKADSERIQKERAILAEQKKLDKDATMALNALDQDRIIQDGLEQTRSIKDSTNKSVAAIQQQSDFEIQDIAYQTKKKADSQTRLYDSALADRSREQRVQLSTKEIEHKQQLDNLKMEFARNSRQQSRLNMADKKNQELAYQKEVSTSENHYNQLLASKRAQFEEKFNTLQAQHEQVISRTEEQLRSQLKALSSDYAKKRDATLSRVDDPFYNLKDIEHKLEDKPDSYLVHINVPEHESENVVFTGHDRKMKITLSRRFTDRVEGDAGKVSENRRSESFSKEFQVADLINSKDITKKYEDGVLTYRIAKA